LKCFEESIGENYRLLTEEMKRELEGLMTDFETVDFTLDEEKAKEIEMKRSSGTQW